MASAACTQREVELRIAIQIHAQGTLPFRIAARACHGPHWNEVRVYTMREGGSDKCELRTAPAS
jgi:hypothetical protein